MKVVLLSCLRTPELGASHTLARVSPSGPRRLWVEREDEAAHGGDVRSRSLCSDVGGLAGRDYRLYAEARR